ncbi:hypothetical protein P7F88_25535 [Vibrio hannami]|uniref:hypothetical protein n=1 Tax=Vibrio hannami TaxID=2717094 RepID=UPI00240F54A3|nr:hypothetical protein [Vibrio hannami]MDG3089229.1 hypothetical protein [Vibrio hannami]
MKIDLIQCTVKILQDGGHGATEVVKAGPGALRATEIPIIRAINDVSEGGADLCCIANAVVVGQVDVNSTVEIDRLRSVYGSPPA